MSALRRQAGAAVLLAMLVVALAAAAAASLLQQQDLALRQLETARDYEQATWVLKGGTQWARSILWQDARASAIDHANELWAGGLPATAIEQGTVAGAIGDQQALFNVNNLARQGLASARDLAALRRLLESAGLDARLAAAIADWIDADAEALPAGGAEDGYYLRLDPPYRAANRPVAELGELLRVRGVDPAVLARLREFLTALPQRTPVNVNLASAELLAAMLPGLTLAEARALAAARATAPFRSLEEFQKRLPRRAFQWQEGELSVRSDFFLVHGRVTVGRADVRMEALLQRGAAALPELVWQRLR